MVWEKFIRICVTGGNRRRTTTGAVAPKFSESQKFWLRPGAGVFHVEHRPGKLARFLPRGLEPMPPSTREYRGRPPLFC